MARRMTSEIIAELQKAVDKHGDLPFEVRDNINDIAYSADSIIFVDTMANGGALGHDEEAIGIVVR